MTYRYPDLATDPLSRAKQDVLDRMHGCPDHNCSACRENRETIENLVRAVKDTLVTRQ